MFKRVQKDYWLHGRRPLDRAFWAMVVFRFGQWVDEWPFAPMRWFGGKIYGLIFAFTPFLTGVFLDRRTKIGDKFHIVHPGMLVIHPKAIFGDRCGVMHG